MIINEIPREYRDYAIQQLSYRWQIGCKGIFTLSMLGRHSSTLPPSLNITTYRTPNYSIYLTNFTIDLILVSTIHGGKVEECRSVPLPNNI